MPGADFWLVALVAATAAHAGFQLTVSLVVYPALVAVPPESWTAAHGRHSRRITPLVVALYAAVLITAVGALLTDRSLPTVIAVAAGLAAIGLTMALAGPLHLRLGRGHDHALLARLLWVDRLRSVAALLSAGAAIVSALR